MSVWKSDEKLLIFASLISPSKIILFDKQYQAFDTVFYHQMNRLDVAVVAQFRKRSLPCLIHLEHF